MFKFIPNYTIMKKILFLLFFPISIFAQEQLTLDNILTISDKNSFQRRLLKTDILKEILQRQDLLWKRIQKKKTQATDWAEYTFQMESFFEQATLCKKNGDCYYDVIVSDVKSKCSFLKLKNTLKIKNRKFCYL